jgi:hypothetical protein
VKSCRQILIHNANDSGMHAVVVSVSSCCPLNVLIFGCICLLVLEIRSGGVCMRELKTGQACAPEGSD